MVRKGESVLPVVHRLPSKRGMNVRGLPEETRIKIAQRAAEKHMSLEAYVRALLIDAHK